MTIDEIRSDLGLEPLGEEDTVEQDVQLAQTQKLLSLINLLKNLEKIFQKIGN